MLRIITSYCLVFLLGAHAPQAATVRGTVAGWNNPALAGARVTLVNPDTSIVREERSASDGAYRFEGVSAGTWLIGASHPGYAYRESLRVIDAVELVTDFVLGSDSHPGRWTTIGNRLLSTFRGAHA